MGGDSNCIRYRELSSFRIMCMDKNGNDTGYRDAMTDQQLQMYQYSMQQQQVEMQQLGQQLQQMGESYRDSSQQMLQQSQQYSTPQYQPIAPYGSSGTTSYRRVGNTVMGTDGSRCHIVGETVLCN